MKRLLVLILMLALAGCATSVIDRANEAAAAKSDAATARCILNPATCDVE